MEGKSTGKEYLDQSTLDDRVFRWALVFALIYTTYYSISGLFVYRSEFMDVFQNILYTIVFSVILWLSSKNFIRTNTLRIIFLSIAHLICHYNWMIWGGFQGHIGYVYIVVLCATILLLPIRYSQYLVALSLLINFSLIQLQINSIVDFGIVSGYLNMKLTFIISAIIVYLLVSRAKRSYEKERLYLKEQNDALERINVQLFGQNEELEANKEEIIALNENLEGIINKRTEELLVKSNELTEMAFVNAHLLRAPLARIMGILNIIELEKQDKSKNREFQEIRKYTKSTDDLIFQINDITSKSA